MQTLVPGSQSWSLPPLPAVPAPPPVPPLTPPPPPAPPPSAIPAPPPVPAFASPAEPTRPSDGSTFASSNRLSHPPHARTPASRTDHRKLIMLVGMFSQPASLSNVNALAFLVARAPRGPAFAWFRVHRTIASWRQGAVTLSCDSASRSRASCHSRARAPRPRRPPACK